MSAINGVVLEDIKKIIYEAVLDDKAVPSAQDMCGFFSIHMSELELLLSEEENVIDELELSDSDRLMCSRYLKSFIGSSDSMSVLTGIRLWRLEQVSNRLDGLS